MCRLSVPVLLLLLASPALADASRLTPLKQGEAMSIQGYGRQNPQCREWTNGCVLCVAEGATAHAECSTPGIACIPAGLTCKRMDGK